MKSSRFSLKTLPLFRNLSEPLNQITAFIQLKIILDGVSVWHTGICHSLTKTERGKNRQKEKGEISYLPHCSPLRQICHTEARFTWADHLKRLNCTTSSRSVTNTRIRMAQDTKKMHVYPSRTCETCSSLVAHIDDTVQNFSISCYSHSRLCSGADNLQIHPESYASPRCHKTLRFRTNVFWNPNIFFKFSVTCCEAALTYKAEGAHLLLCRPLLHSFSFPPHSIFVQPGCYLCCSCMAILQKCSMGVS